MIICRVFAVCLLACTLAQAQPPDLPLSHLNAGAHDPLYTTYAAPLPRSEYFVDEGYYLRYGSPYFATSYMTDTAGDFALAWRWGDRTAISADSFVKPPVIRRSYTDLVETESWPFEQVEVRETFDVYSSRFAVLDVAITNHGADAHTITVFLAYQHNPITELKAGGNGQWFTFAHHVDPNSWSESAHEQFDPDLHDVLMLSAPADGWNAYQSIALGPAARGMLDPQTLTGTIPATPQSFIAATNLLLAPGETKKFRVIRGVQPANEDLPKLIAGAQELLSQPLAPVIAASEQQYGRIPRACAVQNPKPPCVRFPNHDWELAYWSALSQVRQQMMPPEGDAHFNYYLFSREPTWSWGHDGQVFHESIVMQAYALMDPQSAEDSQRVFIERQRHDRDPHHDGYIGYRVGPYVNRTFPVNGQETSSAPFFSWTNWEIYRISHDRKFLAEAYASGVALTDWFLRTHDPDHDGVLVWGGNAMLENVRDSLDVIWNLLGGGDESPKRVKALDLMCMMVKETRSLAAMAGELGKADEEKKWNAKADELANVVRTRMWDAETGFFYNLARDTGTFTTREGISLKRKEIIGFLPLWAGIATRQQAERLRRHAGDPQSFARRYGMPTLAADDPAYDPNIKRCCQWNGAVWLPWNYMVERGLLDYGFRAEAELLVQHAIQGVLTQLRANHHLWESYSPDYAELKSPVNYIWDGIIARMIWELYGTRVDALVR